MQWRSADWGKSDENRWIWEDVRFMWFRMRTSGVLLWTQQWTFISLMQCDQTAGCMQPADLSFLACQSHSCIGSKYFFKFKVLLFYFYYCHYFVFCLRPLCLLHCTDWPASHKRLDHTDLKEGKLHDHPSDCQLFKNVWSTRRRRMPPVWINYKAKLLPTKRYTMPMSLVYWHSSNNHLRQYIHKSCGN
jgi:hypothetical protein